MKQFLVKKSEYNIIVDPIVECFGVLFVLADFSLNKERCNGKYIKKVKDYFCDFKDNELILKQELMNEDNG